MLKRDYPDQDCSAAFALESIGERWTMLVIRDVFAGVRRFDEIQRSLGVASNVLASRLQRLVDVGILERRLYSSNPPRHEYLLTDKGVDLWPILITMMRWGDRHGGWSDGPPLVVLHKRCGGKMDDQFICERCGERVGALDTHAVLGPGATERVRSRHERLRARGRPPVESASTGGH